MLLMSFSMPFLEIEMFFMIGCVGFFCWICMQDSFTSGRCYTGVFFFLAFYIGV
jgi:hypothetical protein